MLPPEKNAGHIEQPFGKTLGFIDEQVSNLSKEINRLGRRPFLLQRELNMWERVKENLLAKKIADFNDGIKNYFQPYTQDKRYERLFDINKTLAENPLEKKTFKSSKEYMYGDDMFLLLRENIDESKAIMQTHPDQKTIMDKTIKTTEATIKRTTERGALVAEKKTLEENLRETGNEYDYTQYKKYREIMQLLEDDFQQPVD